MLCECTSWLINSFFIQRIEIATIQNTVFQKQNYKKPKTKMLFDLPVEVLTLILEHLNPDTVLRLQALTRIDMLALYRRAIGYCMCEKGDKNGIERTSFEFFREKYFMRFLYRESMRVPREYTASFLECRMPPPLLDMIFMRGVSQAGRLVMAIFRHGLVKRNECDWPVFLSLAVNAQKGRIDQLEDLGEEAELAIAMVQHGKFHQVGLVLRDYRPKTVHMVKTMLHFGIRFSTAHYYFDLNLLTQELCEFWFFRSPCDSQQWLVNNIPDWIRIDRMLMVNAGRFFAHATKKTLLKHGILVDRVEWTHRSATFFPALLVWRKKCGLAIGDLIDLSFLHIRLHGRIDHLLSSNRILLRSRLFRPPMDVLQAGANHHDQLFSLFLDRIPFISRGEKHILRTLVEPSIARPTNPLPGYIFSTEARVCILSAANLLSIAYASGDVVLETVV